jgi:outer membrane protein OmpA-like peptidoglycan-associated protein
MARVRIEPGGKVIVALVVLGAILFLFFELKPSAVKTAQPVSSAPSAVEQPTQTSHGQTAPSEVGENHPAGPQAVKAPTGQNVDYPIRIYFGFNHSSINKNVYCIFDRIQELVRRKGNSGLKIVVEGNADSVGPAWYNQQLSRQRAARVADSLARRLGIPRQNISLVANGSGKPIASNKTRDGRADNRRTDVLIYF